MKNLGFKTVAQALLTLGGLALVGCNAPSPEAGLGTPAPDTAASADLQHAHPAVMRGQPELPAGQVLQPLPNLQGPKTRLPLRSLAVAPNPSVVALKVLILSAGSGDFGVAAAKNMLDVAGVPYDVLDAAPAGITPSTLVADDGSGKYQGIILTSGSLSYESAPGVYQSALDWAGWNLLWQYEKDYSARQLSLYTYPSTWPEDYGLRDAGAASANADVKLAAAGQSVFSDFKPGGTLPVRYAYNYPATLASVPGVTTTPLLTDASGRVLAATSTTDGRERLALTFAQNPYLLHSSLVGYGLVNWLTKGVYLGESRRFNQVDVDDYFFPGDVFDVATGTIQRDSFRISASDALAVADQQRALRKAYPVAADFKFAMMYNGGGNDPGSGADLNAPYSCVATVVSSDPLSSVSRCLSTTFDWVSHTKEHFYMDFLNYADSFAQLKPNLDIGAAMGLKVSRKSLLSGNMSGLGYYNPAGDGPLTDYGLGASNVNFLKAAQNSGARYLASNHSVSSQIDPTCASCGLAHPLNPSIFLVPRWPTNMFYNVTDPQQAAGAYNAVYGPGGSFPFWDHPLSFSEILDKESDIALAHVLSGVAFPHYMHQGNLRQYSPGHSLASDWTAALVSKYSQYSTLPLKTLRWDDLGAYVQARTSYMKSGLTGQWNRSTKTVTLRSAKGGSAFVTGIPATGLPLSSSEVYGGKTITGFTLTAGQVVTASVP
ncbi:hypothetical protein ACFFLM_21565 [Deinococcus oregonensis]|uniref:Uncharacterized protein n=1 Tax=Deinococcus oregonensis TaxID=1805970 RepID=A0ABV6B6L0_9DEIO